MILANKHGPVVFALRRRLVDEAHSAHGHRRAQYHKGESFGLKTTDERRAFRSLIFSHDFMAFLPSGETGYALVGPNIHD